MSAHKQSHLLDDYHLLSYDVLDSTNEEAKRLAAGGASHGAFIWAKKQTAGRGRMGRNWVSPEGNLYVSVLLSPQKPLEQCSELSFVAAIAAAETIASIVPTSYDVSCKWPNDILMRSQKLGGILLESFSMPDGHGHERNWVVVGVGINVDSHPQQVLFPATSLRAAGLEIISAKIVLSRFIYHFIHRYDDWIKNGFKPVQKDWMSYAWKLGHPLRVNVGEAVLDGVFDGIDPAGRLLLRHASGAITGIVAGDVQFGA
jgi:BirA family biotin operon repressor/biotin-[acetyl-CoA-carboxylase] ligase